MTRIPTSSWSTPRANYIHASDERPFLQIGESKYGEPWVLELAVEAHVDSVTAAKIALGSMLSTAAANLSVGPPYDIGFYFNDTRTLSQFRIDDDSPLLEKLQKVWERHLLDGIRKLPAITQDDLIEIDDPIEIEHRRIDRVGPAEGPDRARTGTGRRSWTTTFRTTMSMGTPTTTHPSRCRRDRSPSDGEIRTIVSTGYERFRTVDEGHVADYIPALRRRRGLRRGRGRRPRAGLAR